MKILVISQFGDAQVKESSVVPRIGDKIDMFYEPAPSVTQVLMWPSNDRLKQLKIADIGIEAIITVL